MLLLDAGLTIVIDEMGIIDIDLGDPDIAWKMRTLPLLPQIIEFEAEGTHEPDVLGRTREAFDDVFSLHMDRNRTLNLPISTYCLVTCVKK